jgi:hypothetical protein
VAVVGHVVVLPAVGASVGELEDEVPRSGFGVICGADGFVVKATEGGLSPPPPISIAPNGMPTGPTDEPVPVPDEAVTADPPEAPAAVAQVPEAVPPMPPPSNSAVAVPGVPAIGELPMPVEAPADEVPQVEPVLAAGPMGEVPEINGLTAGAASSVAPMGVPVRPTGEPGPKPSGDVMPSGGAGEMLIPLPCASAAPLPRRTAARTAAASRVIIDEPLALESPLWSLPQYA